MRSLAAAFLLSLIALTASAAEADLEMTIYPFDGPRVQLGQHVGYYVVVTNQGPGDAHDLRFKATPPAEARNVRVSPGDSVVPCPNFQCSVALLRANESKSFGIDEDFERKTMTVSTTATVSAAEVDPNPANNTVTVTTEIVEAAEISAFLETGGPTEAEGPATVYAYVYNQGFVPAANVVLDLDFPAGTVITGSQPPAGWTCQASGTRLSCRTEVVPAGFGYIRFPIDTITPARYEGGYLPIAGRISSTTIDLRPENNSFLGQWLFYHLFVVSSTADAGSGTLREAILDANAVCGNNCRIAFRIPDAQRERGWFVIRPESPLPSVRVPVAIAGPPGAQPEGHRVNPQVMLDGSRLKFGNGLSLFGGNGGGISGLAIGNFPDAGIFTADGNHLIEESFIGTWPNGLEAAPNTRGIYSVGKQQLTIRHNVVSGNRRSGITLMNLERPQITRNAIGVGANGVTPVPNGASGVYLGETADWAFFFNNDIAYNADFGIAMHPTVRRMLASVNAIYGNGQLGIDSGIDLETPNVEDDKDRIPNHPVITSARWDEAGQRTIIEGEMHSNTAAEYPFFLRLRVEVYADDAAHPEAHEFLGSAGVAKGKFTVTVKRDLRGTNATAIGIRWLKVEQYDEYLLSEETSEISPAVRVE
ncbi:MAG TPA: NosD domain-containing protein [Thermoanaerobaculia bacterium]|nr:NosD domain-containing protein [Thermoanaerobaculia bacterium]